MWRKVKEKGIGQNVEVKIKKNFAKYVFDIIEREKVKMVKEKEWRKFEFYLGGCDGKIFLLSEEDPRRISISLKKRRIKRGDVQKIEISILGKRRVPGMLVKYRIILPSGKVWDTSGTYITDKNGIVQISILIPVNAEKGRWEVKAVEFTKKLGRKISFIVN